MTARFESKILPRPDCVAAVQAGALPRPIIFTNGVFDILHRGHVTYLDEAAQLGASLIVAINTDESVRRLGKGDDRPLNKPADRAALLAALSCVTLVTDFDEATTTEARRVGKESVRSCSFWWRPFKKKKKKNRQ